MNDQELLNSAMDRAEETLAPAPVETEAPQIDPVEEAAEVAIQEKSAKGRDASGKFTKKAADPEPEAPAEEAPAEEISDQAASAETVAEEVQAEPVTEPEIPAPAFWSADEKALFAKAPREVQEVIARRELMLQQQISRAANGGKKAEEYEQRFYADFERPEAAQIHRDQMRAQGITDPIAELHRYRAWDRVFRGDIKTGISDLMRKNNLTPYDFTDEAQESQAQYHDPRVDEIAAKAEAAERKLQELQEAQAQREQAQLVTFIETFKAGKDSWGQDRKEFATIYAPQIDAECTKLMSQGQALDVALNQAYESVKAQVNQLHGIKKPSPIAPKTTEQKIAEAKKAQAAASAQSGAPRTGMASQKPRLKGNNFNEKFDSAFNDAYERASANN